MGKNDRRGTEACISGSLSWTFPYWREAVGGIIFPADVRADSCIPAHPAGIYGSGGCMAGSTDSRVDYDGGGADFSLP